MPIVRRTRAEIDKAKLLAELAGRPQPSEDEIEAQAIEDGDAWADEELAGAEPVYPPPSPDQVPNPIAALTEMRRVLRPGGQLIFV